MLYNRILTRVLVPAIACGGLMAVVTPSLASHHASRVSHTSRMAPPRDSYLQYKVYNVEQLIQQVSDNPTVRQRFARHFQIPESRVVSYMRANLVESYVPTTGRYTVYCMHPSGKFYPVKQTFHRGTKVFALRNGEPVMKWVCGNPLSKFLPEVQVRNIPVKPRVKVSPIIQELSPAETANVLVPSEIATRIYQPAVPFNLASASSPVLLRGGNSLLPFLLPIALIGVAGNHGGGGNNPPPPPGPAVPEAGTLVLLGMGLPLAFAAGRRRQTCRTKG